MANLINEKVSITAQCGKSDVGNSFTYGNQCFHGHEYNYTNDCLPTPTKYAEIAQNIESDKFIASFIYKGYVNTKSREDVLKSKLNWGKFTEEEIAEMMGNDDDLDLLVKIGSLYIMSYILHNPTHRSFFTLLTRLGKVIFKSGEFEWFYDNICDKKIQLYDCMDFFLYLTDINDEAKATRTIYDLFWMEENKGYVDYKDNELKKKILERQQKANAS